MDPTIIKSFQPVLELSVQERASLTQTASTPGYAVIHRIIRNQVDKFILAHINQPAGSDKDILASFYMAKAAAQFYAGATSQINEEILQFSTSSQSEGEPRDVTEGILDIGDSTRDLAGVPNLLEEEDITA